MNHKSYRILGSEYIRELQGQVYYLEHKKTKAQLLLLDNHRVNKSFSIAFRTPPTDSTGVAHIVEHSTLSGSRKYKTREPFMDMISSSMQTFLNAMTYPDKTVYPISSRNLKDFQQLMDLYLDSVFYPIMGQVKEIFLQEGWHEEIQDGQLVYNGVVYNEMKGVYSDPSNQVSDLIREHLHPSGTYHHDSGGNPKNIPDLSYQAFLDFHRNYYHPSNSYILLAGDLDFEERLDYLDKNYLSQFDYLKPSSSILLHPPFDGPKQVKEKYSISQEEYAEDKNYLALSWNLKDNPTPQDLLLRSFLAELLIESDNALIKRKLLEEGIGEDIYTELSASNTLDFTIIAYHTKKDSFKDFTSLIFEGLQDLVDRGIPKKDLEATLNKFEFSIRQGGGSHQDIISYLGALNTWLYGADPIQALKTSELLKDMRRKINSSYYEDLLSEWLLQGKNRLEILIEPQVGKHQLEEEALKNRLENRLNSLSKEELISIKKQQEDLVLFQMSEDSQEAKETIPKLELTDISKGITQIPRQNLRIAGVEGTFNNLATKGIIYGSFAFDMAHLSLEEMRDASILGDLLGRLASKNYSRADLNQEIYLHTGGISFETPVEIHKGNKAYTPYMFVKIALLPEMLEKGFPLLFELMTNTLFDDEKSVLEILYSVKSDMESSILSSAHTISMARVRSYFNQASYVNELINGLDLYFYLSSLIDSFDFEAFRTRMKAVYGRLFSQENLRFNISSEIDNLDQTQKVISTFIGQLPQENWTKNKLVFSPQAKNEAFLSSSLVNYVAMGYDLSLMGQDYRGSLAVLGNLLSNKYLHYAIRAKGGAYGAGISFSRSGQVTTYSYRDPNLTQTIDVYKAMGSFLRELDLSQRDLTDLIIGTMNSFDPHLAPQAQGLLDFKRYLNGIKDLDILTWKEQAINTSLATLVDQADLLDSMMDKDYLCVIGNEKVLRQHQDLFGSLESLKR